MIHQNRNPVDVPEGEADPIMTGHPWKDLAGAIIMTAADDYRRARRQTQVLGRAKSTRRCRAVRIRYGRREWHRQKRIRRRSRATLRETAAFFRSPWFSVLTNLDGEEFLEHLRKDSAGRCETSAMEGFRERRTKKLSCMERQRKRREQIKAGTAEHGKAANEEGAA